MAFVTITNTGFIPGVGRGPFEFPVNISESKFRTLKRLGYNIKKVNKEDFDNKPTFIKEKPITETKETIEEVISTETEVVKTEESITEEVTPSIEEANTEVSEEKETIVETEEVTTEEEEVTTVSIDELTKKELQEFLTENSVEFDSNANKTKLLELAKSFLDVE